MFIRKEIMADESLAFADQHPNKRFDFLDRERVEVSPKPIHEIKQARFTIALRNYLEDHPPGQIYPEVLHVLNGKKLIPDVCVNIESSADYFTTPPLFVVKIRSDSQRRESQRRKAPTSNMALK